MSEWKNPDCTYYGCPDRKEQADLRKKLELTLKIKNMYYEELKKTENILNQKVKEKQAENSEKVVAETLKIKREYKDLQEKYEKLEINAGLFMDELESLKTEKSEREKKDRELIENINQAQTRSKDLIVEKENLEIEARQKRDVLDKINYDIERSKEECKKIIESYGKSLEEKKVYAAEQKQKEHQEKQSKKSTKKIRGLLAKALKYKDKGRIDKLNKLKPKIEGLYGQVWNEKELNLIKEDYLRLKS